LGTNRDAVVDNVVTIVVLAVANFRRWVDRSIACHDSGDALLNTLLALANVRSAGRRRNTVVNAAVAIVVDVVANFLRRSQSARALPRTSLTGQSSQRARIRERS
jgi:hypothetical protein